VTVEPNNLPGRAKTNPAWPDLSRGSNTNAPARWHLYLQAARAALSTCFDAEYLNVSRHDAVIQLTARGEPFAFTGGGHDGPACAVAIAPQLQYSIRSHSGAGFLNLIVGVIHPRYRTLRNHLAGRALLLDRSDFSHLDDALTDACLGRLSVDAAYDLMDSLLDITLRDAQPAPPLDRRIPWIMRKLDVNIDHPFDQLAAELGLSTSRLSHLFTQQLGMSFRSYQAWARLRQAWEMVTQKPEMSLVEIAQSMRFADAAHLSRTFHANMGLTPSTLRDPRVYRLMGHGLPPGQHIPTDEEMSKS
jgi:AraC family transcriptional regulator of arabinose operon